MSDFADFAVAQAINLANNSPRVGQQLKEVISVSNCNLCSGGSGHLIGSFKKAPRLPKIEGLFFAPDFARLVASGGWPWIICLQT